MKTVARFFSGPVMILAGINHFVMPDVYEKIIPPELPGPRALVYISGIAEIVGGLGTMHPRTRRPAGWFLIGTLLAVFPGNIYMAANPEEFPGVPGGAAALYARLPLQALFIYWVYLAALAQDSSSPSLEAT
ncbi:MAG: DoxX family membrane protein [Actinomycetota bacterium]|nr:DoxX family membrane protein [Actinomycetota bacterium]